MCHHCVFNTNLSLQKLWDKVIVFTGHTINSMLLAKVPLIVRK